MLWCLSVYEYKPLLLPGSAYAVVIRAAMLFVVQFPVIKGQLQRQNKLILSEMPFKILQNETKIIKIGPAVLEIFHFKDQDLDNFTRKNDGKTENVFLDVLRKRKNNRLCDIRNDK